EGDRSAPARRHAQQQDHGYDRDRAADRDGEPEADNGGDQGFHGSTSYRYLFRCNQRNGKKPQSGGGQEGGQRQRRREGGGRPRAPSPWRRGRRFPTSLRTAIARRTPG